MVAVFALIALLAASASAKVVPNTVTAIRATGSTPSTLSLDLDVTITVDPTVDTEPLQIPFTFGTVDGLLPFGSGSLNFIPNGEATLTAVASATWAPEAGNATDAANVLLSDFCSNVASKISVTAEGEELKVVDVNGVGVSIVEQLVVFVTTRTPITKKSEAQIQIFNPFKLPLTFTGLTATAVASNITVAGAPTSLTIGTITQLPLGANQFIVNPESSLLTSKLPAVTSLTVPQVIGLLGAYQRNQNVLPVNANAYSEILIGEFAAKVTFDQVIPSSIGA
ncbi:hypothetical protein HDU67_004387 [Dinochytrium kinnereticum]|nr:hypothetical protein HDU67_004387 [Dinochytrium kinnereticum]